MNNRIEDLKNKYGYKVSYFDPSSIDASFVKETRNKFKMTQSVFAAALNISPKTLEKWEQGKIQMKGPDAILIFLLHSNQELMNEFYKFIKPKGIENSVWSNDAYSNYQEYDTPIRKHSQQLPAAV